jgi:hypothetical protein
MPLRRIFLRVILLALALAGAAGVLGVLTQSWSGMWRIVGTMITTAVAAALMLAASRPVDRPNSRPAALLAMALILAEFLLTLLLIWGLADALGGRSEEEVAVTLFDIAVAGLPAVFFLRVLMTRAGRVPAVVGLVLCTACFAALLCATWMPDTWHHDDTWWATGWSIGALALVLPSCLVKSLPARPWTVARSIGAAAACVAFAMALVGIWKNLHSGGEALAIVATVPVLVAHANLLLLARLTPGQQWVRLATIAVTVAMFALLDYMAVTHEDPEFGQRLAAAAGICSACGSIAIVILARINRRMDAGVSFAPKDLTTITVLCPACQKKQSLPLGEPFTHCANCKLLISVRVQEPRCPNCDYLLYMLQSDRCPECGTPLGAEKGPGYPSGAATISSANA